MTEFQSTPGAPHPLIRVPYISILRCGIPLEATSRVRLHSMANELVRYQQTGDLHFVTFSCYRRLPNLGSAAARDVFEHALERMRLRYDFFVTAYVVMPEHAHLLVSEPKKALLQTAIQALKISIAVQRTERPFWQRRYFDRNLFTPDAVRAARRYIHRNPVKRGLVTEPDQWRWSSFTHWWTGQRGTVEIESNWTARQRILSTSSLGEVAASPTSQKRDVGHTV